MSPLTQTDRAVGITTPLGADVLLLKTMTGTEQLGRLFQFDLQLLSEDQDIAFEDIMGLGVTVRVDRPDRKGSRFFHGLVNRFSLAGVEGEMTLYKASVVPWFWFLTRVTDCRIFQNKTVPDIIKEVMLEYGYSDLKDSLNGSFRTWDYCVQYRESSFNFLSRLMEQEGIYYYFEHEKDKHTMVLANGPSAHVPCPDYDQLHFRPQQTGGVPGEFISHWKVDKQVMSGAYLHRDFNFTKPKTLLESASNIPRAHAMADFEVYDYPGEFPDTADGDAYASVRMQQLQVPHEVGHGHTNARGLLCGGTFIMKDFPRKDQNERDFVISQIHHQIHSDSFASASGGSHPLYRANFQTIAKEEHFRALRTTPKPQIPGVQTAIVTGPSGEEIYTDQYGRVKVQFHWDRLGGNDENSSCWVRVSQNWAGKKWGGVFLPRIGQEVIVEFVEGDPDRPIITGRVYNGDQTVPYDLPANKTQSGVKSRSSKGGTPDNFNEIRFEDKKGSEEVYIHAEKDQNNVVENNETTHVGVNRTENVGNDETITIGNNRTETVGVNETISIGNNRTESVGANESVTIAISRTRLVGANDNITVGAAQQITVGGAQATIVGADQSNTVGGDLSESVGGDTSINVGKKLTIEAGDEIQIKTGKASILMKKDGTISIEGKDITLKGSGGITAKASKNVTIKGKKILQN
jgi:type VI secretion system secreted protein VgrG